MISIKESDYRQLVQDQHKLEEVLEELRQVKNYVGDLEESRKYWQAKYDALAQSTYDELLVRGEE